MTKSCVGLIFVIAMLVSCVFALTACSVAQPEQSEMFDLLVQADVKTFCGTGSITQTTQNTETETIDGVSAASTTTRLKTFDSITNSYANLKYSDNELKSWKVIKNQNGTFYCLDKSGSDDIIVDADYALNESKFARSMIETKLGDDYSAQLFEYNRYIDNIRAEYQAQEDVTLNKCDGTFLFTKLAEDKYKFEFSVCIDYTVQGTDDTRYISTQQMVTEYCADYIYYSLSYTSDETIVYEGSSSTKKSHVIHEHKNMVTLTNTYDSTAIDKVSLDDRDLPTNKIEMTVFVYLDGEFQWKADAEFGTDIDALLIRHGATLRQNCSVLAQKYYDAQYTRAIAPGDTTKSYTTTDVYLISQPNEGYALVVEKYFETTADAISDYGAVKMAVSVCSISEVFTFRTEHNDKNFDDKIIVNGKSYDLSTLELTDQGTFLIQYYYFQSSEQN